MLEWKMQRNFKKGKNMNFSIEEREAFKEVNEIIDLMGQEYRSKIPNKLLELLQKEQDREYQTKIKKDFLLKSKLLAEQHLYY